MHSKHIYLFGSVSHGIHWINGSCNGSCKIVPPHSASNDSYIVSHYFSKKAANKLVPNEAAAESYNSLLAEGVQPEPTYEL
jgi:hypothetical protein